MRNLATETVGTPPWRRARIALLRTVRRPWAWAALAYAAMAWTLAWNAPSLTRFLGSLVWSTLAIAVVAWTVVVWRIVHVSTMGRE